MPDLFLAMETICSRCKMRFLEPETLRHHLNGLTYTIHETSMHMGLSDPGRKDSEQTRLREKGLEWGRGCPGT